VTIRTVGDLIAALERFDDPAMPVLVEVGEGAADVVSDLRLINVDDEPTALIRPHKIGEQPGD
jgi:hypothetical protein